MWQFITVIFIAIGGAGAASSVRIINQGNAALVENLGSYKKRLDPGLNIIFPVLDQIVYKDTLRLKVLDIDPQSCITCDNVAITVDAVVYWQIIDMEKAYYKVENLSSAMVNLVQTQIRAEMGKLELDETFTARTQISEILLQELDSATDPWGVKVTRVELRDITPSQAVQDSMELQMAAERQKRAAILTSEGEKEAAVNSARGSAEAQVLAAEARKKSAILEAEAEQQSIVLRAQGERQDRVLRAHATSEALQIVTQALKKDPKAEQALQFLLAQNYMDMGATIGESDSSKVMFMDPRSVPASIEGIRSIIDDSGQA
ncbi:SPFH domain-containing protein [Acaryochloris marina]|uniref:Band 7 protein, putative n=1 Tax=Acaryochloris marina (strain MBIC 11017) TaxID=329726 RepID=B0C9E3_ACAM1|nr:SPFH domain-containing protein [Acaryochloris marina]ABW28956.1 band 7 protein, putative [Acaryochloris marina MBIC11017]BDM77928.1 paraslipin [Acaryochloris marina MBIC10699]